MSHRKAWVFVPVLLLPLGAAALLVRTRKPTPPAIAPASLPQPTASAVAAEDRTPEVRGRILDGDGNPVGGANVRLVSPGAPYAMLRDTVSDPSGLFSFAHVSIGGVRVVADHDRDGFVSSAVLRVLEGQSTEVTLVLSATSGVRGTVVDVQQHPVEGVSLALEGVPWPTPSATSDEAGDFHLTVLPDEASSLVAVARGYKTAHVALERREDRGEILVRVQLSAALPVEGDVADVDGEPVRAQVVACAGQPSEARTQSAADGTFEFPPSTIGCEAVAQVGGYASSDPVVLVDGRRTRLRLKPGGSIEGVVVDGRGSGVPSFTLGIESYSSPRGRSFGEGGARTFDDVRGSFQWDKLTPGSYVLTASAQGKPPTRSESIEVRGGSVTRGVRIALLQGGSVVGRVFDEHHSPLAGADVGFDMVSSVIESVAAAKTDESGRYHLEGAPAGPLTLRVRSPGFRTRFLSGLRVASGATLTQDVTLVGAEGGAGLDLSGIGANLKLTDKGIEIAGAGAGEPAARAGLQAGDRVVSIDGESSDGMSIADVVQRLRGEAGTSVGVSVERPRSGETLNVMIVRAPLVR